VLLSDVGHGFGDRRRVRPENRIDPDLRDQFLVDGGGSRRLGLIVLDEQLDPPTQDPALLVGVLDAELVAAKLVLAQGRERSGLGQRRTDAQGLLRSPRRR
jgi:hypothetical protein